MPKNVQIDTKIRGAKMALNIIVILKTMRKTKAMTIDTLAERHITEFLDAVSSANGISRAASIEYVLAQAFADTALHQRLTSHSGSKTFYDFLVTKIFDDSPVGDLARDTRDMNKIRAREGRPLVKTVDEIESAIIMAGGGNRALDALSAATYQADSR